MKTAVQFGDLRVGDLYRDVDGTPVRIVRIVGEICCWIPVGKDQSDRQCTLIDYFLVRFHPALHTA